MLDGGQGSRESWGNQNSLDYDDAEEGAPQTLDPVCIHRWPAGYSWGRGAIRSGHVEGRAHIPTPYS